MMNKATGNNNEFDRNGSTSPAPDADDAPMNGNGGSVAAIDPQRLQNHSAMNIHHHYHNYQQQQQQTLMMQSIVSQQRMTPQQLQLQPQMMIPTILEQQQQQQQQTMKYAYQQQRQQHQHQHHHQQQQQQQQQQYQPQPQQQPYHQPPVLHPQSSQRQKKQNADDISNLHQQQSKDGNTGNDDPLLPTSTKKTKRITQEQKDACFKFFKETKYNRNSKLPTGGTTSNSMLLNFLETNGISRGQMRTQLNNWKKKKYEFYGEVYETDPVKVRQLIASHLPDDPSDFLDNVLRKMIATKDTSSKDMWFAIAAKKHEYFNQVLPKMNLEPFKSIFLGILDKYIDIATNVFPKQAKLCCNSDMDFYETKMNMVKDEFEKFHNAIKVYDGKLDLDECHDEKIKERKREKKWKMMYAQIEEKLYYEWCLSSYIDDLPPISIVINEGNINKYSCEILYYTAGCVLNKIDQKANRKKETKTKDVCGFLSFLHSIDASEAEEYKLPYKLTKVR